MKKLFLTFYVLLAMLTLTACGSSDKTDEPNIDEKASEYDYVELTFDGVTKTSKMPIAVNVTYEDFKDSNGKIMELFNFAPWEYEGIGTLYIPFAVYVNESDFKTMTTGSYPFTRIKNYEQQWDFISNKVKSPFEGMIQFQKGKSITNSIDYFSESGTLKIIDIKSKRMKILNKEGTVYTISGTFNATLVNCEDSTDKIRVSGKFQVSVGFGD